MSINPNGAPPGYYYQAGATAYTIDPAGTYSVEGATAPTVDGAGTYSLAGASTPTSDPGGTYSAAGASAPTQDRAGTYSSPYALDTLFLETSSATPNNEVLSFNSVTAVANYYGNTSAEAGMAAQFFADYGTAANMLFIRFPIGGNRAHLYGGNVSTLDQAQLDAINGNLSVISQGYKYSATINLTGVTSFTAAATAIQAALNENLPVAAVTTGDTITPVSVSFTGSANGLLLDVTSVAPDSSMEIGALISGAGVPAGTQINAQFTGQPGGAGLYSLYVPAGQISSEAMTESYGMLTVGSVSSGTVADGEQLTDTSGDLLPDTAIEANLGGSGAGSTWVVNNSEAVSSETMTMTGAPLSVLYTAITGATQNSGYFSIQQNGDFNYASASLTYATGAAAAPLGLTEASGAWLASPGTNITSEAAFMSNLVATLSNEFGSFQSTWSQLAQEDPALQTELEEWAQSTDGQFQFLENNTTNASPAGTSSATIDPAGTYSGPGASAPTLAAAGTYIPSTGATSSAAEKFDLAGTYSPAGASAATTDPAGTYSGARASAPMLAAAGTYIPGTGATSTAAEKVDLAGSYSLAGASAPTLAQPGYYVATTGASSETAAAAGTYIPGTGASSTAAEVTDLAGSYSLAGASAPTLAQPGYYVATAGASSETPVSTGYYQPNPGATSEILAQSLAILGTVAGQTVAPLENVTPFSSVKISDPNTGATDTLTIELSGGGGLLSDGAGFDGLTTSGSGVYLLTGTAAAITAELDALIFTPSASTTPTNFTLTDTSTAGTSANDAKTTVTVESTPVVVSVATYLAEKSTLDGTQGGFDILDTAAAITAYLDQLDDTHIVSIDVSDSGEVSPSVQQLTSDATAIGKLQNANSSPVLLAVNDSAADIEAGLSTLVQQTSNIASITASSGGPVAVSAATFLADQSTLDKIAGGFDISDTAADVANNLNALNADLNVSSIALTDAGVPTLSISLLQAENDTRALDEITTPHAVDIADNAPRTITSTEAIYLSSENITVNGAAVIATGTVATMAILAQIETSLLENQGYTLAVLDTAANIEGLTLAQINNLSLRGVLLLEASDTSVALTASLAVSLEAADMTVTAPSGSEVTLTAPKASVSNLTPATIAGLPVLGVTAIVSTNGSVTVDVAQALALEGADLGITVPSGDSVTLTDLASNLAALTPSQIDALAATGVSAVTVSNGANLDLSAADAQALEASNLEISGGFDVSDTAANVAANIDALNGDANVTSIVLTDGGTPALSLDVAQALDDRTALGEILSPYTIAITDTAAKISANLAAINTLIGEGQVSSLTTTNVTGQPYSSYEQLFDDGVSSGTDYFYTNVTGEPYSSYEYDYSAGNAVIGSKFYYTGITGQAYTGEEVDYNGAGLLTRTAFTGVTDPAYSAYQYNYVGGVVSGSQFTFTTVPTGATFSSYEVDYNQAGNFTGDQFFFTNIQGQFFTGEEVNLDANGALSGVLLTGIADQAYSSLELDYSAGTYEGYQAFYTGITGQAYTSEEVDASAAGQLEKVIYSGMTSTPYSSDEVDYSGGAVSDVIYNYTNVTGQPYYADQVEVTPGGAGLQETLDLNNGGHDLTAMASGQTLTSLGDDVMTGSATGSTTFVLNAVYGADTIANLTSSDIVSMPTSEFANFTTLSGAASFATGAAVITASDGDTLTLDGITTSAQLKNLSGDFTFHS